MKMGAMVVLARHVVLELNLGYAVRFIQYSSNEEPVNAMDVHRFDNNTGFTVNMSDRVQASPDLGMRIGFAF
jgi:hypothetical protein